MTKRFSLWMVLASAAALAAMAACTKAPADQGDDDDDTTPATDGGADSTPPADSSLGILGFQAQPASYYTGFDGTHTFQVPIAVHDGASDLTVTVGDPSIATIAPAALANPSGDKGTYYMLTALKAGSTTLTATSGGKSAQASLTVTAYAADRWAAGQTRYTTAATNGDPPCTQCHVDGQNVDHSPTILGPDDDQTVAAIITTGLLDNFPIQGVAGGHRWSTTPAELDGLVTYLRALQPRGFK